MWKKLAIHFFTAEAALEIAKGNSRDSEAILESDISPLRIHMLRVFN